MDTAGDAAGAGEAAGAARSGPRASSAKSANVAAPETPHSAPSPPPRPARPCPLPQGHRVEGRGGVDRRELPGATRQPFCRELRYPRADFGCGGDLPRRSPLDSEGHLAGCPKAPLRVPREPLHDQVVEFGRQTDDVAARGVNRTGQDLFEQVPFVVGLKEPATSQHLPEDHGGGIHIDPR